MGKLLSGTMAIPSILTLVALAVMIEFQDYHLGAITIGLIAVIWFVAFLIYHRQSVNIEPYSVEFEKVRGGTNIRLKGFIWSRHPDGLSALELYVISAIPVSTLEENLSIPKTIDSRMQDFTANYFISDDIWKLV